MKETKRSTRKIVNVLSQMSRKGRYCAIIAMNEIVNDFLLNYKINPRTWSNLNQSQLMALPLVYKVNLFGYFSRGTQVLNLLIVVGRAMIH